MRKPKKPANPVPAPPLPNIQGEFYVDYDDESGFWCVFHTEDTRAYSSWPTEAQAKASLPQSKGLK